MPFMKGVPNPHGKVKYSALTREEQLQYMREANRKAYAKKVGGVKRNMNHTPESRAEWARLKAENRCTRAKQARVLWEKELTNFVYKEAHNLRRLKNKIFNFEWHVDHVLPLRGKLVCGLHVWNNFAVIPKVENLRKGNKNSIHEERAKGLQEGASVGTF